MSARLVVTDVSTTQERLRVDYEIRNHTSQGIWICASASVRGNDVEVFWAEDGKTLTIRRRTEVQWRVMRNTPLCRYVRLPAGKTLAESAVLPIPLRPQTIFGPSAGPADGGPIRDIAIEIGYYAGDLPARIRDSLLREEVAPESPRPTISPVLGFNETNEDWRLANDDVYFEVDPVYPVVEGEKVLRTFVRDKRIPYDKRVGHSQTRGAFTADLSTCTRVEIACEPSILEYFYPSLNDQRLLSSAEAQRLRFVDDLVVSDIDDIRSLIAEIVGAVSRGIVVGGPKARVGFFRDSDQLAAIEVYEGSFVAASGEPFSCHQRWNERLPNLRAYVSELKPFELRVGCAGNLRDLYNRFRYYHLTTKVQQGGRDDAVKSEYPVPADWCDQIIVGYMAIGMTEGFVERPLKCPGADGRSHYAMNMDWTADSPADTVLLFETKAGWNQYGGPDLFTFDNHDPRGGCVLLNDGTVRFIRTEEELNELRWK